MRNEALRGVQWISIGSIIIGFIFIIAGAIITGIAYTEITPPNYDDNYNRYIGASAPRLLGPFILCFGALLIISSCGIMAYQSFLSYEPIPPKEVPIPINKEIEEEYNEKIP